MKKGLSEKAIWETSQSQNTLTSVANHLIEKNISSAAASTCTPLYLLFGGIIMNNRLFGQKKTALRNKGLQFFFMRSIWDQTRKLLTRAQFALMLCPPSISWIEANGLFRGRMSTSFSTNCTESTRFKFKIWVTWTSPISAVTPYPCDWREIISSSLSDSPVNLGICFRCSIHWATGAMGHEILLDGIQAK